MKKRNKKSSQQTHSPTTHSDLPNECWESIFKFVINDDKDTTNNRRILNSLSLVSKQFLAVTYRLRFSLNIHHPTHLRHLLVEKYTNVTSLNFSCYYYYITDLNNVLRRISRFPLKITSLNLSNRSAITQPTIPVNGLRAFSKNITTLTSLICSNIQCIKPTDLFVIAECFPLLEELELSYSTPDWCQNYKTNYVDGVEAISNALFKLRKVNLSGSLINDQSLYYLLKNCKLLQEVIIVSEGRMNITDAGIAFLRERPTLTSLSLTTTSTTHNHLVYGNSNFINSLVSLKGLKCLDLQLLRISNELLISIANEGLPLTSLVLQFCIGYSYTGIFCLLSKCRGIQHLDLQNAKFLNDQHIVDLSLLLGDLVSINLSDCNKISKAALFSIAKNCPLLIEIEMERIGSELVDNSEAESLIELVVHPQLKYLYLCDNSWLNDERIIMFASIFPNLELLDLSSCNHISKGICQILKRCCNISHLYLAKCSRLKLVGMNFLVPKLEVLDLSFTKVDDKTLFAISKNCPGLLQLLLEDCDNVTEKGVKRMEENCTLLMPSSIVL